MVLIKTLLKSNKRNVIQEMMGGREEEEDVDIPVGLNSIQVNSIYLDLSIINSGPDSLPGTGTKNGCVVTL